MFTQKPVFCCLAMGRGVESSSVPTDRSLIALSSPNLQQTWAHKTLLFQAAQSFPSSSDAKTKAGIRSVDLSWPSPPSPLRRRCSLCLTAMGQGGVDVRPESRDRPRCSARSAESDYCCCCWGGGKDASRQWGWCYFQPIRFGFFSGDTHTVHMTI